MIWCYCEPCTGQHRDRRPADGDVVVGHGDVD